MKKSMVIFLFFLLGCLSTPPTYSKAVTVDSSFEAKGRVGLDILLEKRLDLILGKKIGLVTNNTGLDKNGTPNYDRLLSIKDVDLKIIFSPEHGLFGESAAGEKVSYNGQVKTLPTVVSLYGENRKPKAEQLSELDIILYDIQDVGARFYTYISTMGLVMEAAAESGVEVLILDRPNPITGSKIEGPILDLKNQSFVGKYPIPIRYGLTAGELAKMIVGENWINNIPNIKVIPIENWQRSYWYDQVNIPWQKPSPNIPDLETAIIYPGLCLLEATNISEGRGTDKPFKRFGAPWINKDQLVYSLQNANLLGVNFKAISFIPTDIPGMANNPKYENQVCHGIEIKITNRDLYDSVLIGVTILEILKELYPNQFVIQNSSMDRLWGISDYNFLKYKNYEDISNFTKKSKSYYIYE